MELSARGCNLSIRAAEAREVQVVAAALEQRPSMSALAPGFAKSAP
jgi:hypothetical protein